MSLLSFFSALAKSFQKSGSDRVNHLQSFTKYLRLTLVFMWTGALQKKFNFCFSTVFARINKIFTLEGRLGTMLKRQKVSKYYENGCRLDIFVKLAEKFSLVSIFPKISITHVWLGLEHSSTLTHDLNMTLLDEI